MSRGDVSLACASSLVDELARGGMRHACLSPGSRSTPIALALERDSRITVHVHLDERSSAFFALGIAKAKRAPVAAACTSGTAAAEFFPAVVEASQARVPLVLLTADRPPELRGTGANQTIDQVELYGRYARAYLEPPVPSSGADLEAWRRAGEASLDALSPVPGPVHVNCPFEEPLVPGVDTSPSQTSSPRYRRPREEHPLTEDEADRFAAEVSGARGVVIAGGWPDDISGVTRFFAEALRWPVLAEPTSGVRLPDVTLTAGQALLASPWLELHRPEVVLQIGAAPTTRATHAFVASAKRVIVADRFHLNPYPQGRATMRLHVDPPELVHALEGRPTAPAPEDWLLTWQRCDDRARGAINRLLDSWDEPYEGRVARDLAAMIPDGGTLVVGSSMPVRDLDYYMVPRKGIRVLANRGASGIDGFVSTALGVAATDAHTFALCGDLTFIHDVGALMWNARRGIDAVFVVPNNGGGTIFDFLSNRELPEHERLFVTPHGLGLGAICGAAGAGYTRVERAGDLIPAFEAAAGAGGIHVVEVPSDRERNLTRHSEVQAAVDAALRELP